MQNLGELNKTNTRRPYWLLLVLALFFAGQIAVAGHWHNDAKTVDADCALCVLSSATSAAITSSAFIIAGVAFCTFARVEFIRVVVSRRLYFYNSRAPPSYS